MTQLKDGGRQPGNREERSLSASTVIVRWQGNGWDEPCKSRGLRTVLWAAGGEIPPADPAIEDVLLEVDQRSSLLDRSCQTRVHLRECEYCHINMGKIRHNHFLDLQYVRTAAVCCFSRAL